MFAAAFDGKMIIMSAVVALKYITETAALVKARSRGFLEKPNRNDVESSVAITTPAG
jgi:hypothetical protein